MKLNQAMTELNSSRVIQQFGEALLVQHQNGRHELLGGSLGDLIAAREWVSLFAHEIVFTHPGRPERPACRTGWKRVPMSVGI
jgi:hypothetical protein